MRTITLLLPLASLLALLASPPAEARRYGRYGRGRTVQPEGFQSPIHRQSAGRVLFSKRPIPRGPRSRAGFTDRFTLRDPIYLRPMLATSMDDALRKQGVRCYKMRRRIAQVQIGQAPRKQWVGLEFKATHPTNFGEWMTYSLDSDGKHPLNGGPTYFPADRNRAKYRFGAELLPRLGPGAHKLTFHITAECYGRTDNGYKTRRVEVATGTITLTLTKRDLRRYFRTKGPFIQRSRHRANRRLRRRMMKTVARKWRNERVRGARILSPRWNVVRHRYLRRTLRRWVDAAVVVQRRGATRCRVFTLGFTQRSLDGRRRFAPEMTFSVGSSYPFPCVNAP